MSRPVVVVDVQRGFADPELLPWVPADSIGEISAAIGDLRSMAANDALVTNVAGVIPAFA